MTGPSSNLPKIHALDALLDHLAPPDAGLSQLRDDLVRPTPCAVELRYPGASVTEKHAREAIRIAREVRAVVRARLDLEDDEAAGQ